ncbi:Hydantoinase B/oxoprolinase [compost metagenome]
MGLRRVYRAEADCRVSIGGSRFVSRPWGLDGGLAGGLGSFTILGAPERLVNGAGDIFKGDILEIVTPGAGGYGEPSMRDPASIAADVRDGRISSEAAKSVYGL